MTDFLNKTLINFTIDNVPFTITYLHILTTYLSIGFFVSTTYMLRHRKINQILFLYDSTKHSSLVYGILFVLNFTLFFFILSIFLFLLTPFWPLLLATEWYILNKEGDLFSMFYRE